MKHVIRSIAIFMFLVIGSNVQAALIGPGSTPYLSFSDSPFSSIDFSSGYWNLEDFEVDGFNQPGVTATGSSLCVTGIECFGLAGDGNTIRDSVDGVATNSHFANGPTGITYTFDAVALGALPTHVGIVWTDGNNPITFIATDNLGNTASILGNHATSGNNGETNEDRFYGADLSGFFEVNGGTGFSSIFIKNGGGGIEVDHLQFGCIGDCGITSVPEPSVIALFAAGLFGLGFARRRMRC